MPHERLHRPTRQHEAEQGTKEAGCEAGNNPRAHLAKRPRRSSIGFELAPQTTGDEMKGLFPWLREMVFGPLPPHQQMPKCVACEEAWRDVRCASGYCWQHHWKNCCVQNYLTGEILYTCREQQPDGELAELRKMIQ